MRTTVSGATILVVMLWAGAGLGEQPRADSAVYFYEQFDDAGYRDRFTNSTHAQNQTLIDDAVAGSHALRFRLSGDGHYGGSLSYYFAREGHDEPDVLYARYHLRFAEDWNPRGGGKLPGPAGTYNRAGWGGRPSDGTNGWSARGSFRECRQHPGHTLLGFYTYHADMRGRYGSGFRWDIEHRGCLAREQWYQIDMEIRMNTPGDNDGVLRGWVDGELAMEKTDLRFRDTTELKIQQFWMNLYHGGSNPAPHDMHLDYDGVVLSSHPLLDEPSEEDSAAAAEQNEDAIE